MFKPGKSALLVMLAITIVSLAVFIYRLQENFYQAPLDFLIFLKAAKNYQQSGELYQRAENYEVKYHPSAVIFKFPPPFELALLPLTQVPRHIDLLFYLKTLLTGMYVLSIVLVFFYLRENLQLSPGKQISLATLLVVTSCWFMPYFESIRWLLAEIPLLLLFIGSFLLLQRNNKHAFFSGALIAYAACIKIYPAFMAGIFLLKPKKAAITGLCLGTLLVMAISIAVFGIKEHLFFFSTLLPVLMNEEVTGKWINLNLEKFLYITGVIPEIHGHIFQLVRLLMLSALLALSIRYRETFFKIPFLFFSFLITTMFFCFPNYWPQYQIYLIIPLAYLYATYLRQEHSLLLILAILLSAVLCIPDNLWENLATYEIAYYGLNPVAIQQAAIQDGIGLTLFKQLPLSWASYYLYESRALVPLVFWLLLLRDLRIRTQPGSW